MNRHVVITAYQKTARKPLALAYVIILLHNNK